MFPQQEGEVGQGHGQTTLRQGLPAKACEHRDEGPSQHQAYGDASEEYAEKIQDPGSEGRGRTLRENRSEESKEHNCRSIVKEAFPLHKNRQPLRGTNLLKDGHHRHGVRGRTYRPEHKARHEPHPGNGRKACANKHGGQKQPKHRQEHDRREIF